MDTDLTCIPVLGAVREAILQKAPLDSWIALSHDQLRMVAASTSMNEAIALSEAAGEPDPVMLKTPPFWGEYVGDWPTRR